MQVQNTDKIFKMEIAHEVNKPMSIKVWSDNVFEELSVEGSKLSLMKSTVLNRRCVSYFSFNTDYKAQIKSKLMDFISVGLNYIPDMLVGKDSVKILGAEVGNEFIIQKENITQIQYKNAKEKKLNLSFNANWQHMISEIASSSNTEIVSSDWKKLSKTLPSFSDYKKMRILGVQIVHQNDEWCLKGNELYKISKGKFDLDYQYYIPSFRSESLSFSTTLDAGEFVATKDIEYSFKIPHKPAIALWEAGKKYYAFDLVDYQGATYEAQKEHAGDNQFSTSNWRKIKRKRQLSFNNCFSFFKTDIGNRCFEKITYAFHYEIERHLGDSVTLMLVNAQPPKLNDFFKFEGKKFRVIKFIIHKGPYDFLEVVGQQCIDVQPVKISDSKDLIWEHDSEAGLPEVVIYKPDLNRLDQEYMEGIEIRIPDELAINSKCILNLDARAIR